MMIKRTPIALAIGALLTAPLAVAQENGTLTESYAVSVENAGAVSVTSTSTSETVQRSRAIVDLNLTSKAQAVVDDKQLGTNNSVNNAAHTNNASVGGTAGGGVAGNIGVNSAAGDNNMQDNAAAIAAADAYFVFGAAESRTMTTQISSLNTSNSTGSTNNALVDGAFASAGGNIGINVGAGNGNMQKNNLAVSTAPSRFSIANVQNVQRSKDNVSTNSPLVEIGTPTVANITLDPSGATAGYTGTSDQIGNVYLDIWDTQAHNTGGSAIGHVDVDEFAQGAQDLNDDGGAFAFNEVGSLTLGGQISGTVEIPTQQIVANSINNAQISGNSLNGAAGNIGVNVASGNGNLQNNSLSMAVSHSPVDLPGIIISEPNGGSEGFR